MLSTASIVCSSFAGPVIGRGGSSIMMQEAPTVTLNGLPGTPGGPEFAKTLPGVLAPFGYLCASLILTGRFRPALCAYKAHALRSTTRPLRTAAHPAHGSRVFSDPLNLVEDCAEEEILRFREAELMHGRVAMMATLGFAVQEGFHPIFDFADGPAAHQLDIILQESAGQSGASLLLLITFMTELTRAKKGWQDPDVLPFALRDDYTPGDIGFDPLGLKPKDAAGLLDMQNKEINNGRLAMIAIAGIVAQECITDSSVF